MSSVCASRMRCALGHPTILNACASFLFHATSSPYCGPHSFTAVGWNLTSSEPRA